MKYANLWENILLFQQKALPLQQQIWRIYTIRIIPLCKHSGWYASIALFLFANNNINSIHKNSKSSAQLSAHENFFSKKYTHAETLVIQMLPACCIYQFILQNLQSSYLAQWARTINRKRFFGTKTTKCRKYGIIIIYGGTNNIR